jgi:hypothetical protein
VTNTPDKVGLPIRPFLYTLDQIANLLDIELVRLKAGWIHYRGRTIGRNTGDQMEAIDISPVGQGMKPEWRVSEQELIRWMKRKGFRVLTRSWNS